MDPNWFNKYSIEKMSNNKYRSAKLLIVVTISATGGTKTQNCRTKQPQRKLSSQPNPGFLTEREDPVRGTPFGTEGHHFWTGQPIMGASNISYR